MKKFWNKVVRSYTADSKCKYGYCLHLAPEENKCLLSANHVPEGFQYFFLIIFFHKWCWKMLLSGSFAQLNSFTSHWRLSHTVNVERRKYLVQLETVFRSQWDAQENMPSLLQGSRTIEKENIHPEGRKRHEQIVSMQVN